MDWNPHVEAPSGVPGGCPLMNTAIDADDGNPVLRALVKQGLADWKGRISHVVKRGIGNGEIVPETEPRRIANVIIATLEGALMMSRLEGTKTSLQDARTALDLLLEGIRV
jgi:TetR/AcrR family transcriptional repressor of nem operon